MLLYINYILIIALFTMKMYILIYFIITMALMQLLKFDVKAILEYNYINCLTFQTTKYQTSQYFIHSTSFGLTPFQNQSS